MWLTNRIMWFYPDLTLINVFYYTILDYPMTSGNLTDENIKSVCCLLWIFETRIAIMITINQHRHHDCKEGITMFDIIEIITQL